MTFTAVLPGIPVSDLAAGEAWYTRLFGRPPDMRPADHEVMWLLNETGCVYVLAAPEHAGHGHATLIVDDLDRVMAEVAARAIPLMPVETVPGGRKTIVIDPDGNRVQLAEVVTEG